MAMNMHVPQLLTPEEPLADSFSHKAPLPQHTPSVPSPPASPEFDAYTAESTFRRGDQLLYPDHTTFDSFSAEKPLFDGDDRRATPDDEPSPATESTLSVATPAAASQQDSPFHKSDDLPKPISAGPREDRPTPVGPIALAQTYGLDYYRYMLAQSEEHRAKKMAQRQLPPLNATRSLARDQYTAKVVSSLGRSARIEKPKPSSVGPAKVKVAKAAPPRVSTRSDASIVVPKSESSAKRSRRQTSTPDASLAGFPQAAQPKPRTRAAPTKKIDDKDASEWQEIPDRCPPISSLDGTGKKLTVQWTNANALDLSNDPDRHHLHPQEFEVAQVLRLRCNQYLANKRRIFAAKVAALQEGKEYNKTSAQTSTKIDVNKASRLWIAFDNVGWFDEKWFQQYL